MTIDPALLAILVCPVTRTPLHLDPGGQRLVSASAGLAYPIRNGVPVLLAEEALPWPPQGQGALPLASPAEG